VDCLGGYEEGLKFLAEVIEGDGGGGTVVGLSCVGVETEEVSDALAFEGENGGDERGTC